MYIRPNFAHKNESLNILLSIYPNYRESQGEVYLKGPFSSHNRKPDSEKKSQYQIYETGVSKIKQNRFESGNIATYTLLAFLCLCQ